MTISFEEFVDKYTGKSVANPRVGTYKGQCVSLCQMYLYECAGVPYAARGNGKDYASNLIKKGLATKASSPKKGDIISFPADYYQTDPQYGHVAIYYDSAHLFQQNVGGDMTASLNHGYMPPITSHCTIARPKNVTVEERKFPFRDIGRVEALFDDIRVRTKPNLEESSDTGYRYMKGMQLNYQNIVNAAGWLWAEYVSYSGRMYYCALCKYDGSSNYWKQV